MRILGRIGLVLACALLLAACGNDPSPAVDEARPVADQAASTPPPTPASLEMEVGPIIWAQEIDSETGEPVDVVTRFTTESPAIIAVIEASEIPAGTEFAATWTINDQPIEGFDMDIAASDHLDHAWIAFRFTRDSGQLYPVGQLTVVITTSEGDLREDSVEIGFP